MALIVLAVAFVQAFQFARYEPQNQLLKAFAPATSNLHFVVTRPVPEILPSPTMPMPSPQASAPPPTVIVVATNLSSDLLSVRVPPDPNAPPTGPYAPTGRLLECVLVNAADSLAVDAPLIGLVVSDLYHAGRLIIPVGTEVHGRAQLDRVRDRLASQPLWKIVWQTGKELVVAGMALDREFDAQGQGWSITDGRKGLQGEIVRSHSLDEIKLFLATALSGFAAGMQQQSVSILGYQHIPGNARNAALNAASQVLNTYAQEVLAAIKRDGLFVFVHAGKRFYLYVDEPIDLDRAQIAGSRVRAQTVGEPARPSINPVNDLGMRPGLPAPALDRTPPGILSLSR